MRKRIALGTLLAALLACGGGVPSDTTADAVVVVSSDWDGSAPFECGAMDNKTIRGVNASIDGTAVTASGMCKLTIEDSTIVSTGPAVQSAGQAEVTLVNSILTGTPALSATGASTIRGGADLEGETQTSGQASIDVTQQAATGAAATPKPAAAPAAEATPEPKAAPATKPAAKAAPKPAPTPKPPNCTDIYSQCDWDRHCASIGDASERSACSEGCWELAYSKGCEM